MYNRSFVGITQWAEFSTPLSLNLAPVNMLPLPILDPGVYRFHIPQVLTDLVLIIAFLM